MISGAPARILSFFMDADALTFSTICDKAGYPTDLGGYYIRHLVAQKWLVKTARGLYKITPQGKQALIVMSDKDKLETEVAPKLYSLVVPTLNGSYVVMRRRHQPLIGTVEWPAAKVRPGEHIHAAALRALQDRFLTAAGELEFRGFYRRLDNFDGALFDDKLFAVHTFCYLETETIAKETYFCENLLVEPTNLDEISNPSQQLFDILRFTESGKPYDGGEYDLTFDDMSPSL
jgi:predicted transcriptional regulator